MGVFLTHAIFLCQVNILTTWSNVDRGSYTPLVLVDDISLSPHGSPR